MAKEIILLYVYNERRYYYTDKKNFQIKIDKITDVLDNTLVKKHFNLKAYFSVVNFICIKKEGDHSLDPFIDIFFPVMDEIYKEKFKEELEYWNFLYEKKFGYSRENFSFKDIRSRFDGDVWIDCIGFFLIKYKKNDTMRFIEFRDILLSIASEVYLPKFYEEVSLEEQMNIGSFWWDGGFSFNVSLFKPLKRSVLFN